MSKVAYDRLRKEFARLSKHPVEYIEATPLESNMLEWHYVITGPKGSPYEGGLYHGKLVFPPQYPYKPPSIQMLTPSGRFQTNTRICLSMSDFHPESWSPSWHVSNILTGLLSFMLENTPTVGSVESSDATKREHAARSLQYNLRNPTFRKLFPHYTERAREAEEDHDQAVADTAADVSMTATAYVAAAATATANVNVGAESRRIGLFGGRISIREKDLPDYFAVLLVVFSIFFAFIYYRL